GLRCPCPAASLSICLCVRSRDSLWPLLCSFFNLPAPPASYTLSLHDALPISTFDELFDRALHPLSNDFPDVPRANHYFYGEHHRSEEHTSELQSREKPVCRLLPEKKKTASGGHAAR